MLGGKKLGVETGNEASVGVHYSPCLLYIGRKECRGTLFPAHIRQTGECKGTLASTKLIHVHACN